MYQILKIRLPTCTEYDQLADTVKEDNGVMHWKGIYSWCQDADPNWASFRTVRGWVSARSWDYYIASDRYVYVGFRPAFEILDFDPMLSDGTIVTVGTLYMNGQPVKVPQNPVWNGDVPGYIPGTKLELREVLDDADYQVRAIKVGSILIADRVLVKNINWFSVPDACVCHAESGLRTWSVPVVKTVEVQANSIEEALAIGTRKAEHIGATLMFQTAEEYLAYLNS